MTINVLCTGLSLAHALKMSMHACMLTALLKSTAPAQVPDLHQAYIFYCDGLGFTQDPGTWSKQRGGFKVLWFNLGRHQVCQQHAA